MSDMPYGADRLPTISKAWPGAFWFWGVFGGLGGLVWIALGLGIHFRYGGAATSGQVGASLAWVALGCASLAFASRATFRQTPTYQQVVDRPLAWADYVSYVWNAVPDGRKQVLLSAIAQVGIDDKRVGEIALKMAQQWDAAVETEEQRRRDLLRIARRPH